MSNLTQSRHYDFVPIIDREPFRLPDGARVAVMPYLNIEHFPADISRHRAGSGHPAVQPRSAELRLAGLRQPRRTVADGRSARRVQCPRDRMPEFEIIREYPRILEEGMARNWAWIGHGVNNAPANFISNIDEDREREILSAVLTAMEETIGRPTKGWLSPFLTHTDNTPRLLEEFGVEYLCDYTADDHPFRFNTPKNNLIAVPYTVELNDIPAFGNVGVSSEAFGDMIIDQFDVLYEEGATNARCMPICLHTFWVGQPNKFKHLARAFRYMAEHEGVWFTTGDDVNDWYRENFM